MRWIFGITAIVGTLFCAWPQKQEPISFYSNQTRSDLTTLIVDAIDKAEESLFVVVYGLSDPRVCQAIQQATKRGVEVKVIADRKASAGCRKLLKGVPLTLRSGVSLMHQKVIVVDQAEIWLGSANFTSESLRLHGNLIMKMENRELARALRERKNSFHDEWELWLLPDSSSLPLERVSQMIREAKKSVRVAMFTLTHERLCNELIAAKRRGLRVQVVADRSAGHGASARALRALREGEVSVALSEGAGLLHHKFCLIDNEQLIHGSANWTHAAFERNDDLLFILKKLSSQQKKKLGKLWKVIWAESR